MFRLLMKFGLGVFCCCFMNGQVAMGGEQTCRDEAEVSYLCGPVNAEDMLLLKGIPWVIASGMGKAETKFSTMFLLNTEQRSWQKATISFPKDIDAIAASYADCPSVLEPGSFGPHGISMRYRPQGGAELYVVNHGERESIEVFDVRTDGPAPSLSWKGCVVAPENASTNSVTVLPGGGLAVTSIVDKTDPDAGIKLTNGENTGFVLEWFPEAGWQRVPNSELSGNNGIEASADGEWLYVAGWGDGTLARIPRAGNHVNREDISLGYRVDNIRWNPDRSHLIVAGHIGTVEDVFACLGSKDKICTLGYAVTLVDVATFKTTDQVTHDGSALFGAATSAIEVDDRLWVGTFRGNRVAIIPSFDQ